MSKIARIGIDTSKGSFQLHGVNEKDEVVLRRTVRRRQFLEFMAKLEPTVVGLEACGASHHWARELARLGHRVMLIPPQAVKPYVSPGRKNDKNDAEAICEAMSRPRVRARLVPVKSVEQSASQMLMGVREGLLKRRTQLCNTIRGHAAEFGLVAAKGLDKIEPLLARIAGDDGLPPLAREMFADLGQEHAELSKRIAQIDRKLATFHRSNELSRRLMEIPDRRPGRGRPADHQDHQSARLPLRPPVRGLGRVDAEEPFDRRQAAAGRHHPGRRRELAGRAGQRRHRLYPAGQARPHHALAVARRAARAQAAQAGGGGARQQDRAHRLEADDQRRALRSDTSGRPRGARRFAIWRAPRRAPRSIPDSRPQQRCGRLRSSA